MLDDEFCMRKSTRRAAMEAAERIKKNAEDNAQKYPLYRSDVATSDNNMRGHRGRKQKTVGHVFDSTEMINDSSNYISDSSDPQKSDDMHKKRRGRPPKSNSAKCPRTNARCKEEIDCDAKLRRESYNSFLLNNEPTFQTIFPGPKQLQLVNGNMSYRESLLKFTKDLGPTALKVASRMLQRRGNTAQAQHQLEPLFQSQDSLQRRQIIDLNSINCSPRNTTENQVSKPLFSLGHSSTDAIANNKGKNIMVDDGKSNRNKWDVVENLEFLFGKPKGGIKIGNDSLDNRNFGNKNLDHAQVGSFWSNYNVNLNQNVNKISGIEDISTQKEASWNVGKRTPSYGILNSSANPSTYLSRPRNVSSSNLGFDGEISPWVPQPQMHSPTPVQPPRNRWLPPPASTMNSVVNENFWREQELQLALAVTKQKKDHESNVRSQNIWAPSQANQFQQAQPHGLDRQQPQDRSLTPLPPHFWSRMVMSGANPDQDPLPFGTLQDSGFKMGNQLQHPPPGI